MITVGEWLATDWGDRITHAGPVRHLLPPPPAPTPPPAPQAPARPLRADDELDLTQPAAPGWRHDQ